MYILPSLLDMKAREVLQRIKQLGGTEVRKGKGSHVILCCACGRWRTTVSNHKGEDIKRGTLGGIEGDLAPCQNFGEGWLTK